VQDTINHNLGITKRAKAIDSAQVNLTAVTGSATTTGLESGVKLAVTAAPLILMTFGEIL
jgi:hypothetical protein